MRFAGGFCLLALVGCSRTAIFAQPATLAAAAGTIREHGSAQIGAVDEDSGRDVRVQVESTDVVTAALPQPDLFYRHTRAVSLSLSELLVGCPAGGFAIRDDMRSSYPACQLIQVNGRIEVGRSRHVDGATIVGLTLAGSAIGLGVCAFACDAPIDTVSGLTLVGGTLVAITWSAFRFSRSMSAWH